MTDTTAPAHWSTVALRTSEIPAVRVDWSTVDTDPHQVPDAARYAAAEVADLVGVLAAYVAAAGGDWSALAAGRPGWAAGCNEHHAQRIA